MPGCAIYACSNYSRKTKGTGIRYFSFPKNKDLSKKWINACRRLDAFNIKHACICSVHFENSNFEKPLKQQLLNYTPRNNRNLKDDAVPTLNLPSTVQIKRKINVERAERITKRNRRNEIREIIENISHYPDNTKENEEIMTNNSYLDKYNDTINVLKNRIEALENENCNLKLECEKLQMEKNELLLEITRMKNKSEEFIEKLKNIFTTGQINVIMESKKKCHWNSEDIAAAISLRSVSPKAYRFLRNHNYPLPALSTIRKWALTLNVNHGILKDLFFLMKIKSRELNILQRLTVIAFDEIYLSNKICIDKLTEQKLGPHKCCQTVMARGLCGQWKQPVYYNFDQAMTQKILNTIISFCRLDLTLIQYF